jgi:hypothetical protein
MLRLIKVSKEVLPAGFAIRKLGEGVTHDPKSSSDGERDSAKNSRNSYSDVQAEAPSHSNLQVRYLDNTSQQHKRTS